MRFALLGPLELTSSAGEQLQLAGPRQRILLATLLLHANMPVPSEALAEAIWDGSPPAAAMVTLRSYIKRLRQGLGAEGRERIAARDPGYMICVREPELDVLEFGALCKTAGAALRNGDWAGTATAAARALALWRTAPLLDVPSQLLADEFVPELERLRLQALEDCFEARLRLGKHQELTSELRELTAQHPLRERFHAQLMLALAGTGRQAEALEAYTKARQVLVGELGIEPGPELRDLHQQILAGDIATVTAHVKLSAEAQGTPPRQLPAVVADFTGRAAELAVLTGMLEQTGAGGPGTVVISAIGGTAGVGKTALALHWAHQVARRFADGQLYVNLRGFDPSASPASSAEAIRGFLDALGLPPDRIPPTPQAQAGLYRSLLADRKMLVVLDNARDEEQVRPLLPASPGSLVVVTSRHQLSGLAAADGARLITLDVLSHAEAVQLLTTRLGHARATAEAEALSEIATLCAYLPLALAVAAARAADRPAFPLAALAGELRDVAGRLDALDSGDPVTGVRAVFSWSYRRLSDEAARMFRMLGIHPGPDITAPAAASLAAIAKADARRMLRELTRAHLVAEHVPGRYALHDLLRGYAAEQARDTDSDAERDAAVGRVLDHYLCTAADAALLLMPAKEPVVLTPPGPGVAAEQPADNREALAWFEAERQVLSAAVTLAAKAGFDTHAWQLPWAMASFYQIRGQWQDWAATQRTALTAATRLGDTAAQALSGRLLASACIELGEHRQARRHYASSLTLCQQFGNRLGEAKIQHSLGTLANRRGRYADALGHAEQALRVYKEIGDKANEAEALNNVGWYHALLGHYQQARTFCRQALTVCATVGYRFLEGTVWDSLGYAEHHLGNLDEAAACYQRAVSLHREGGDRPSEAEALIHLGDALHAAGKIAQAREAWQQALDIFNDLQDPAGDKVRAKLATADDR
jgi:DNA-binding SARP family transcriptional activator/tetratricopeptide (TPR) repeat protein